MCGTPCSSVGQLLSQPAMTFNISYLFENRLTKIVMNLPLQVQRRGGVHWEGGHLQLRHVRLRAAHAPAAVRRVRDGQGAHPGGRQAAAHIQVGNGRIITFSDLNHKWGCMNPWVTNCFYDARVVVKLQISCITNEKPPNWRIPSNSDHDLPVYSAKIEDVLTFLLINFSWFLWSLINFV